MIGRRTFASAALLISFAAAAAGARMLTPPAPSDPSQGMPAGWEFRDDDVGQGYHKLTISHPVGSDRLDYSIDLVGRSPGRARPSYAVRAEGRLNCLSEERADVGAAAPADRARLTRALLDRALAALEADCVGPGRRVALLEGFEGAYAALVAQYERLRPAADAAYDALTDQEREELNANLDLDSNADMNMVSPTPHARRRPR